MAESLSVDELYLSRSLGTYEKMVLRYESQIQSINDAIEEYKEKYNRVLGWVSKYTKSFEQISATVSRYAKSGIEQFISLSNGLTPVVEVRQKQLLKSEELEKEFKKNIEEYESQKEILLQKKEDTERKIGVVAGTIDSIEKFPKGTETYDAIIESHLKRI